MQDNKNQKCFIKILKDPKFIKIHSLDTEIGSEMF